MKFAFLVAGLMFHLSSFGQKLELFKGIDFDSSYTIIGIAQGYDKNIKDSLTGFWFLLDDPKEMEQLKQEWVFKSQASVLRIEEPNIDIYVIQNKRIFNEGALIFPEQGIITKGVIWYRFDTARLSALHKEHPFKYHTEKKQFEKYNQYAAYGNSILNDSLLIFFQEPSVKYEGRFNVIANLNPHQSSSILLLGDFNHELRKFAPETSFSAEDVMNDSFNINHSDKVKLRVNCSKSLYDAFKSKTFVKGDWEPAVIEIKTFWKD